MYDGFCVVISKNDQKMHTKKGYSISVLHVLSVLYVLSVLHVLTHISRTMTQHRTHLLQVSC
jgi:hypothetical protein